MKIQKIAGNENKAGGWIEVEVVTCVARKKTKEDAYGVIQNSQIQPACSEWLNHLSGKTNVHLFKVSDQRWRDQQKVIENK